MTNKIPTISIKFQQKYLDYPVTDEKCNHSHSKTPYWSRKVVFMSKKISNWPEKTALHSLKGHGYDFGLSNFQFSIFNFYNALEMHL